MASSFMTSQIVPAAPQLSTSRASTRPRRRSLTSDSQAGPADVGAPASSSSHMLRTSYSRISSHERPGAGIHNLCNRRGCERVSSGPSSRTPDSTLTGSSNLSTSSSSTISSFFGADCSSMLLQSATASLYPISRHPQPKTSASLSATGFVADLRRPRTTCRSIDERRKSTQCRVATTGADVDVFQAEEESGLLWFLTSERAKVVAMVAMGLALCNADRVVMSVAIVPMAAAHGWSQSFAAVVQSSFLWGYLLSQIAGGALADRHGGKSVMGWGVAIWSLATLLTPWAARHSLWALLAMRVVMGVAEGVAMPCMNNMIYKWFPRSERSRAVGMSMAGFHLGSVAGLVFTPALLVSHFGLQAPFVAFGLAGFAWLSLWLAAIAKNPQSQPRISRDEYLYIQRGNEDSSVGPSKKPIPTSPHGGLPPFGLLLSKLPVWAIIVANFMNNWGYFILLGWMPIYFNTVLGVNLKEAAWFSAVPWAMMAAVGCVAGACSDALVQSGVSVTATRKLMQAIGFLGPAVALLGLNAVRDPMVAVAWLTAAVGLSAFSQAGFLINYQEIGPKYAGVLHGMSNTVGTLAAIISTMGVGLFIERLGSFQSFLTLTSVMYIASTVFWVFTATGERVFH